MSREREASRSDVLHRELLKYGTETHSQRWECKDAWGARQESFNARCGFVGGFKIE